MSIEALQESIILKVKSTTNADHLDMLAQWADALLDNAGQPSSGGGHNISDSDWASIARGDADLKEGRVYSLDEVFAEARKQINEG